MRIALLSLCLAIVTGCNTPQVFTTRNPQAVFSEYRTFALLPFAATGATLEPDLLTRIVQPTQQAARETVAGKGYAEVDLAKADLVFAVRGQSLPRVAVTDWGYRRVHAGWGTTVYARDVDVRTYDERTVTVEVYDNRTKQQVWAGWSTREATGPVNVERLQADLRCVLAGFPPKAQ